MKEMKKMKKRKKKGKELKLLRRHGPSVTPGRRVHHSAAERMKYTLCVLLTMLSVLVMYSPGTLQISAFVLSETYLFQVST